jgi:DNA-binding transcriptional LysR family regulator
LRQAAEHIAVTQPAATRMLKELEDALGVALFDRCAWGMQATPYGETMIRYARGVLTDLSEARDEIAALAAGAKGKLRIGSVTGAVPGLLAPALQKVRLGRPGLKVFVLVNASDVLAAALRKARSTSRSASCLPTRSPENSTASRCAPSPCVSSRRAITRWRCAASSMRARSPGLTWILHPPQAECGATWARSLRAPVSRCRGT